MRLMKRLLIGACPIAVCLMPAFAQSTGTEQIETVTVTGTRTSLSGLMNAAPIAKERSVVTSEFLNTQTAGQTVFAALNFMPGINFTNNDPYGSSGGNIRMHGQDGNHISLTLDGMPLNDTGNYAIYTNQMLDPEVVDRVTANQGATDVDSPTAAATGGVINISSDKPHDEFGAETAISAGDFSRQRYLVRVDSGAFGPYNTTALASFSYQDYDKFRGTGHLKKIQGNLKFYQDLGDIGWFSLAAHWNTNRNNSYYSGYYLPVTSTTNTAVDWIKGDGDGGMVGNPAWVQSTSTSAYTLSGTGWDRDYSSSCVYNRAKSNTGTIQAPSKGTVDYTQTSCGGFYKVRINPSDTGNVRFQSLWHVSSALTLTLDANLQYVLANGGGYSAISESDSRLKGNGSVANAKCTTAGCDLNGDGDTLDTVAVYSPSTTNTRRWGLSSSLIYQVMEGHTIQLAYTLDYGLHRQTGQMASFDNVSGPYSVWGGLDDDEHAIKTADNLDLRTRDRKSKAIMNQVAFDYEGKFFADTLMTSIGFRDPFFERDLNQYCYEQINSSSAYCTSQTMYYQTAKGYWTTTAADSGTKYVAPDKAVVRYNRFLPHLGITFLPFGKEHQFFVTYAQEMAAARTDNLYVGGYNSSTGKYGIVASSKDADGVYHVTRPETSATYQFGYRFLGENLQAAVILWNSQVKNRIVSSYDPDTGTYFDHNVPGVNFTGIDFESVYHATEKLTFYANAGYDHARITTNIRVGSSSYAQTLNKQLTETPKWLLTGRVQYEPLKGLRMGFEGKYVSRRNATEDNNVWVPAYATYNADVTYDLDDVGLTNSSIRLNADNVFNKHYFGSLNGTQTCWSTATGCTSLPYMYTGVPRTVSLQLLLRY